MIGPDFNTDERSVHPDKVAELWDSSTPRTDDLINKMHREENPWVQASAFEALARELELELRAAMNLLVKANIR